MIRIGSLRLRITLWYVGFFSLLFVLFGFFFYLVLARDLENRLDESLSSAASTTAVLFADEMGEMNGDPAKAAVEAVAELRIRSVLVAVFEGGRLLGSSGILAPAESDAVFQPVRRNGWTDGLLSAPHFGAHGARIATRRLSVMGGRYLAVAVGPMDGLAADLQAVQRVLLIALPLLIGLAGLGGYLVASRSLAPLNSMAEQARRITGSNLDARLEIGDAAQELAVVTAAFNELLSRLNLSFESMRRFVADASHELRTPLAVIRGEADVALSKERAPAEYRESLAIIQDESRRLSSLVEGLLNLARADAHQAKVLVQEFYLNDLVSECCRSAQAPAAAREIALEWRAEQDLPFSGDEELLRHMLANLLDNAIRYTPPGGRVSVALETENGDALIRVSDTGVGIPPDAVRQVFDRFFRVDQARSRNNGGLGLGLAIVKWIAESHRGTVGLESEVGAGSTFTVKLPTTPSAAAV